MRISDWSSDVCSSDLDVGGRGQRRAAPPLLDDARVAGRGHRTVAEVAVHAHGVVVDPAQRALGFGAEEAAVHPMLRRLVELAGDWKRVVSGKWVSLLVHLVVCRISKTNKIIIT